jgi:hypothetical protein
MHNSIFQEFDCWLRINVGIGLVGCSAVVVFLALTGAVAALVFPKCEATALLDTPGASTVELKQVLPGYASGTALQRFLVATGTNESSAAQRLITQARSGAFWEKVATPVVPITRKDTKEIGDLKDGLTTNLIGLELKADAGEPETAEAMVLLLGNFYANALLRERIRGWIVSGQGESRTRQKTLRADTISTQLEIDSTRRRITALESIVAHYPEASRMEGRQVVSVAEGGDRFLPPTAQLVAAESQVSRLQESILRNERRVRQLDLLAAYYERADAVFKSELVTPKLIQELQALADSTFTGSDSEAEWSRETRLRTEATVAGFAVVQDALGIRNGTRVAPVASRSVSRLALLGAGLGLILIAAVSFIRVTMRAALRERQVIDESFPEILPSELKRVA